MPVNVYELPIPGELIFNVLEEICRASKLERDQFVFFHKPENLTHFPSEYRFGGNLGSGGKFYISNRMHDRWYVDGWSTDMTDERLHVIDVANKRLEMIRKYFIEVNDIYKRSHLSIR